MEEQVVLIKRIGRVGIITLNRPQQLNALNDAVMDRLGEALLALDAEDGIGAIVLTGGAKAFAAGADIAAMADWSYIDVYRSEFITRNWEAIRSVRKPVIAAGAGFALGGGCELALACDLIVAAQSARFALPEIKPAMLPGAGGTQRRSHAKVVDSPSDLAELSEFPHCMSSVPCWPILGVRVSSDSIQCVQRSDRSTTTSLTWTTGAMSV